MISELIMKLCASTCLVIIMVGIVESNGDPFLIKSKCQRVMEFTFLLAFTGLVLTFMFGVLK